jgi:hypothetical protein
MTIVTNFKRLSFPNFLAQAQRVVTAMTGNPHFPEPWSAPTPTLAQITADFSSFASVYAAVSSGDRTRLPERNGARDVLTEDLQQLAAYLQMMTKGDPTLIATSGFDLHTASPRPAVILPLPAPADLRISRGDVSGTLIARVTRMSQAAAYDVQLASADPTVETNWNDAGTFSTSRRMQIVGLTPGKTYSVRVRAINSAGPGAWTVPGSLMIV